MNCNVEDLCAEGWHVCLGATDVKKSAGEACVSLMDSLPPEPVFFVVRVSGGSARPRPETAGLDGKKDDLFGCGNLGRNAVSSTLNVSSGNRCSTLDASQQCCTRNGDSGEITCANNCGYYWSNYTDKYKYFYPLHYYSLLNQKDYPTVWVCGNGMSNEADDVLKPDPQQGGVLCCRNECEENSDCAVNNQGSGRTKCFHHTCKKPCSKDANCNGVTVENNGYSDYGYTYHSQCFEGACSE